MDDNITLNIPRFAALCEGIIRAGLNGLDYYVQAMTSAIATHGVTLAPLMRRAGFRYVFLGIENLDEENLKFLNATAKNTQRDGGRAGGNATFKAIELLHGPGMLAHTLRGCRLSTLLGLEDERQAFQRYRALRSRERSYL